MRRIGGHMAIVVVGELLRASSFVVTLTVKPADRMKSESLVENVSEIVETTRAKANWGVRLQGWLEASAQ